MSKEYSIFEQESIDEYLCDGRNVSKNCLKKARLRICSGCALALCKNCFKEHKEYVDND